MKIEKILITLVIALSILLCISIYIDRCRIAQNKSNEANLKAYIALNDTLRSTNRMFEFKTSQLNYINDSLVNQMNTIRKSIGVKDRNLKGLGYIKSNTWNWSGVGPQGTGSTVRKIASITDMSYLEIDGGNSVGTTGLKGIVKISITYINGIIISNNSTVSTNFGYVITSTTGGNNGKVNIDLYLQERSGENYYNILVSKLVGSAISFESPSAAAITAPSGYVAIS